MRKEIEEISKDIPFALTAVIEMDEPNQKINIYEGVFILEKNGEAVEVEGKIWFDWLPNMKVRFRANAAITQSKKLLKFSSDNNRVKIKVSGLTVGEVFITETAFSEPVEISGGTGSSFVFGDKSVSVSEVLFAIPNFKSVLGSSVRFLDSLNNQTSWKGRLTFENEDWTVIIDRKLNYSRFSKELSQQGGYHLLYDGLIERKSKPLSFNTVNELRSCLFTFLSFLNGRRCSPLFLKGIHDKKTLWADYTAYNCDLYKYVDSWTPRKSFVDLNEVWNEFYILWNNNEDDKDFLTSAVHWYIEANSNSGYVEGSIVMIQTALELLYNWLVIEKRRVIHGRDAENISAANKIRLLLSQFRTKSELPGSFINIENYIKVSSNIHDEVDVFVEIRNAIIHAQREKRLKLSQMTDEVKIEAQQLGLWYIEISLLNILKYKGKYRNRCSGEFLRGGREEYL